VAGSKLAVLGAVASLLAAVGVGVNAALATTGPDPYVVVNVRLTDAQIVLHPLRVSNVTFVDFLVHNAGKLTHNFSIGGHSTRALKPGQTAHLFVGFPVEGAYPFLATVHAKPAMRGRLRVLFPVRPG